jgi:SAM-dependent methyltransferase
MEQIQPPQPSGYAMGHAADELDRLINQARFFGDLTEHVLRLAGLARGMRVLDAGCGPGDVTFLAAKLVGAEGMVIGVDKSLEAIGVARQRTEAAGLTNVQFLTQDFTELVLDEPVDALIGRLVLQYLADPALVLRRLATFVKPGGVVAFQEGFFEEDRAYSEPVCQLYETALQRIIETFARIGANPRTEHRMVQIFQAAGLPAPQMILHDAATDGTHRSCHGSGGRPGNPGRSDARGSSGAGFYADLSGIDWRVDAHTSEQVVTEAGERMQACLCAVASSWFSLGANRHAWSKETAYTPKNPISAQPK